MGTIRDRDAAHDSWYATTATPAPAHPRLEGRERADVVVLGAGLTGLSTALELAQRGLKVVVVEAHRVGWGASGRSGGQVIFGYGCDQSKIATHGRPGRFTPAVRLVGRRRRPGAQRIAQHRIDCDWRDGHAHVPIKPRQVDELQAWQRDLADNYDYPTEWWDRDAAARSWPAIATSVHCTTRSPGTCIRSTTRSAWRAPQWLRACGSSSNRR